MASLFFFLKCRLTRSLNSAASGFVFFVSYAACMCILHEAREETYLVNIKSTRSKYDTQLAYSRDEFDGILDLTAVVSYLYFLKMVLVRKKVCCSPGIYKYLAPG